MTDDFDPRLLDRLDRLAAAVPVVPASPSLDLRTQRPEVRGRVQFGALATMVLLLIVVAGSGLFGGGHSGGGEAVGSMTDGAFTLTIRSPRDHYRPDEAITVEALVEFIGSDKSIDVWSTPDVVGFGVEQVGGPHRIAPGSRLSCGRFSFASGQTENYPFVKSGGFYPEMPDADFIRAYLNISGNVPDPVLRLPAGTWSIFAVADLAEGDCGGTVRHTLRAAITVVVEGADASTPEPSTLVASAPSSTPSQEPDRTFPGVCPAIVPSLNQCAGFAAWAVGQSGVTPGHVQRIEMTKAQCPGASACRTGAVGYVVGVRIVTDAGTLSDQLVNCTRIPGSLGGINFLCDTLTSGNGLILQYPNIVSPISGGYHDVPCAGPAPESPCATALPTIEPSALSELRPLTINSVEIPIDHVGTYAIDLGEATLPNGILTSASAEVTSSPTDPLVSYDGYALNITSLDGGPPFENYYAHGWRPGVEHVGVTLSFTVLSFQPGAAVVVANVDVH